MRGLGMVLLAAVAVAACSGDSAALVDPVDRLVVIGDEGQVMTVDPDGSDPVVLSEEGTSGFQPVWSPDATRIAWGSAAGAEAALSVAEVATGALSLTATVAPPFYLSWAPGGDQLGLLRNDTAGLAFETATIGADGVTITTLDTGAPYYFDWRPDGERVAIHVGLDRFDIVDLDGDLVDMGAESGVAPGTFQAPQWIDRGILIIAGDLEGGDIVLVDEDTDTEVIARTNGLVSFAADPAGDRVAVYSFVPGDRDAVSAAQVDELLATNTLSVIDLDDGTVTEVTGGALMAAFQWSPDGEKLLVLHSGSSPGELMGSVWSEEEGLVDGPQFVPLPGWVNEYLPFHDQYARSMTLWSPDSGSFAFVGLIDDRAGVWRHDLADDETSFVIEGTWVVWSPV